MKLIIAHQFFKPKHNIIFFPLQDDEKGEENDPIILELSKSECDESYSGRSILDPNYILGEEDDPIIIESSKSECDESYSGSDILTLSFLHIIPLITSYQYPYFWLLHQLHLNLITAVIQVSYMSQHVTLYILPSESVGQMMLQNCHLILMEMLCTSYHTAMTRK